MGIVGEEGLIENCTRCDDESGGILGEISKGGDIFE